MQASKPVSSRCRRSLETERKKALSAWNVRKLNNKEPFYGFGMASGMADAPQTSALNARLISTTKPGNSMASTSFGAFSFASSRARCSGASSGLQPSTR